MIPKVIYQTYSSQNLPELFQDNVAKIKALNPDWEYRLYTNDEIFEFVRQNLDRRMCDKINPNYAVVYVDLFKYLLIHKFGGVYLDIKSTLTKPLSSVLLPDDQYVLSTWKDSQHPDWGKHEELAVLEEGELQQWHIMAAPGHPFLQAVLERIARNFKGYDPRINGVGKIGVLRLTGPFPYTLAIHPLLASHPHRFASNGELGIEYSILSGQDHKKFFGVHYSDLTQPILLGSQVSVHY